MKLQDRVAIVTGSTSGMGKATAMLLAKEGAKVVITGRDEERAKQVVETIRAAGGEAFCLLADSGDTASPKRIVEATVKQYGAVDILVNNAAKHSISPFESISLDEWEETLRVNVTFPMLLGQLVFPLMKQKGKGVIVNISSIAGAHAKYGPVAYCASKHAMVGLTKAMALEFAPFVRVNGIMPGAILTPMLEKVGGEAAAKYMIDSSCTRRVGQGEDIAQTVLFLASDDSSYIAGQMLRVDGGLDI